MQSIWLTPNHLLKKALRRQRLGKTGWHASHWSSSGDVNSSHSLIIYGILILPYFRKFYFKVQIYDVKVVCQGLSWQNKCLKLKRNKWSVILFICRKTLAACMRTRDCGLNSRGDVKKVIIEYWILTFKSLEFIYKSIVKKYIVISFYHTFKIYYHVPNILQKF